ncbi:MAG: bifunctional phosphoribosylaminoimidazolecarboxamide formyltransferase/inosine monophosphate cyclohydrolase [Clostridia bacterium BRH_c25]|nr:MAG: bifunctional phosphoribosylaminoimidazolecarboxamide formyltransferase/inosine monophosphate cyclohydrolase [Clostridia bacterium BRH_c25]
MIKRAIISVSDKTGIVDFARELAKLGVEIISTGGTAKALEEAGIKVIGISEITGYPECLDGRVKTLHPNIHGGLLAVRDNPEHMNKLNELGIDTIDMVVVNLYPFRKTIEKEGVELSEAIENIDIGGPSMLRAAAKNYKYVTVVVDPADYQRVLMEIKDKEGTTEATRFELAAKVFSHTASYDTLIGSYLWEKAGLPKYPETVTMTFEKVQDLRYGENPHQAAAYYREMKASGGSITAAVQLHGKELSFNNINDANAALETLKEFEEPAAVALKHANPCGVGVGSSIYEAYIKAYEGDPISIFGGIIALNREVDEKTASEIGKIFVEIVIAPAYSEEALNILMSKKNIRIMKLEDICRKSVTDMDIKKVGGGLLMQDADWQDFDMADIKNVTDKKPTDKEMKDMLFAWKVVKHVKSNAIVVAKDGMTLGIGPGQTNRIWSADMSLERSGEKAKGAVIASDAFFPFGDVVTVAAKAGITAIIQPGGSMRDQESIDECNNTGIAMIFTGMRHFKH